MKEDIRNSVRENFIHEPSVDFTSVVMQRIESQKMAKKSSNEPIGIWIYVILFCILGTPICLIVGYAIFQNITIDITEVTLPKVDIIQYWNVGQFFVDVLPYSLFLLVFFGIIFAGRLRSLLNSNLNNA